MRKLAVVNLVLALSLAMGAVAFAADDIAGAANTYFGAGTKNIKVSDLYDNLNDGDTSNDPFLLDLRSAEDYALGHIPGAVNIGAKTLFTTENLAKLPTGKQIVAYCYTGQTSSQAASVLNMMGYDATNLKFGMPAWAMVEGVSTPPFDTTVDTAGYAVETKANEATGTFTAPTPLAATIQAAADAYFSAGTKNIKVSDLYDNLNDGDTSNDPFILDLRSAEDYALGHIPGAVNIGAKALFTAENLAKLPADKQIVANCYTGQTSSQAVSVLNMLGYDATNLKFGVPAWAMIQGVSTPPFAAAVDSLGYSFEGTGAAAAAPATPAAPAPAATAAPAAAPETMPATGGMPIPLEGMLIGLGALSAAAGLALSRRKAA